MVFETLAQAHFVLDVLSMIIGASAVILGIFVIREVTGQGNLKKSMIFATISTLFFTLTQVVDYVGELYSLSDVAVLILEKTFFLLGMVLIFFAGSFILKFFRGISFNKR